MELLRQLREVMEQPNLSVPAPGSEKHLPPDKRRILYRALNKGDLTEAELQRELFGAEQAPSNYSNLKDRLLRWLVNRLILVNPRNKRKQGNEHQFFRVHRTFLVVRFLLYLGARPSAISLLEKLLPRLRKLGDTRREYTAYCWLRNHYGLIETNPDKYRYYRKLADRKLELSIREARANALLEELLYVYRRKGAGTDRLTQTAHRTRRALTKLREPDPTPLLEHRYWFSEVIFRMTQNNYPGTAIACNQALSHLASFRNCPPSYLRTYLFQLVVCHIQSEQFTEADRALDQLQRRIHPGNSNWFKTLELRCIRNLRSRHYRKAADIWQEATQHPAFRKLYETDREIWRILEAYLHYLKDTRLIGKESIEMPRFRLGRFLNEVPELSRDKKGYNVNMIILQLLFSIRRKKFDRLIDRAEALEKYTDRYLRGAERRRSRFFLKMLIRVPITGGYRQRLEAHVKTWETKLRMSKPQIAREPYGIEFVPYEDLWKTVVDEVVLPGRNRLNAD